MRKTNDIKKTNLGNLIDNTKNNLAKDLGMIKIFYDNKKKL